MRQSDYSSTPFIKDHERHLAGEELTSRVKETFRSLERLNKEGEIKDRHIESEMERLEITFDHLTALKFEMCVKFPPTTEQHKTECRQLMEKIEKEDKMREAKRGPW